MLALAELSAIVNRSYDQVRKSVREREEEMGETLPMKGYRMDQGSRPTHKGDIIRLYEQGLEPPDIARETGHNQKSVDRYLDDYERVKMLLKLGSEIAEIGKLIGRGKHVVLEYVKIAQKFHPNLCPPAGE